MKINGRTMLAGLAILALAGCGGAAATSATHTTAPSAPASSSAPATARPANPVPIVRQAGAVPDPGEVYGTTSMDGWLSGHGTFPGKLWANETITVYTLPPGLTGQQAVAQVGPMAASSDSQVVITGSNFYIYVEAGQGESSDAPVYPVSPATIAARVHGQVMQP